MYLEDVLCLCKVGNHLICLKFQVKELEEEREAATNPASVAGMLQVSLVSVPANFEGYFFGVAI